MSAQHKDLAAGRWSRLPFVEQMANVGSEVGRALDRRARGDDPSSRRALERALELIDLTLESAATWPRRKEVARAREVLLDCFSGGNRHSTTEESWQRYFHQFAVASRRHR